MLVKLRNSDWMYAFLYSLAREQYSETTWFLDVYGPATGVAAVVASFHSGHTLRPDNGGLDWLGVKKPAGVKFKTLKFTLVPGYQRAVLFPDLSTTDLFPLVAAFTRPLENRQGGKSPLVTVNQVRKSERVLLARVLQAHTIWPMLDRWADGVWDAGLSSCAVKRLDSYGALRYAWLVDMGADWGKILQEALDEGKID